MGCMAGEAFSGHSGQPYLSEPAGSVFLWGSGWGRTLWARGAADVVVSSRRNLRHAGSGGPRAEDRRRSPRGARRSRYAVARGFSEGDGGSEAVRGAEISGAGRCADRRNAGVPVRKHLERGLSDRPASRNGECVVRGRGIGARIQAWAGVGGIRGGAGPGWAGG